MTRTRLSIPAAFAFLLLVAGLAVSPARATTLLPAAAATPMAADADVIPVQHFHGHHRPHGHWRPHHHHRPHFQRHYWRPHHHHVRPHWRPHRHHHHGHHHHYGRRW
ncbi:hypothetical protein GJ689_03505 [Rhodoplanes serenus]|uniref:Uncharacterized protein n=1 Tax=Rhodoplanes serenus TaxID=200615 RepID=A0A9X5AQN4_9BRAD|nr:hypothetical protein [Rhodoplanes serenus]MTW15271.1 hypothetical protein [Rhodoplanes serenus]